MVPLLPRKGIFRTLFSALACLCFFQSCAVFFPDRTAPKSSSYHVHPPAPPWHRLAVGDDPNSLDSLKADMAFENPDTGGIISVNSICRKYNKLSLEELTNNLLRGVGERKAISANNLELDGARALDSIFEGIVDGVKLQLRTVVMIKDDCTYDFIHVSVPHREKDGSKTFEAFLASFHTS